MYASMAALKTAKPAHPTATACGPAFLAKIPPVKQPPATPLYKSFLARRPSMAHSVPENIAPTLAKLRPLEIEDLYMSRRPARSCCRSGRSLSSTAPVAVGFGRVAAAEAEGAVVRVAAEAELTLLVAIMDGFAPAVAVAVVPAAAVVGLVAGVLTGRGCDMGVSYRICTCQSCLLFCLEIWKSFQYIPKP